MRCSSTILWAVSLLAGADVASAGTINVLLLSTIGSVSQENDIIAKIQADASFINITPLEVTGSSSTPTLATLETYQTVMVVGNNAFGDAGGLGNVLQQYVAAGFGLVVTAASNTVGACGTTSSQLCGSFNSSDYWAIEPGLLNSGHQATLGSIQVPGSPLLNGVTSFNGGSASLRVTGTVNSNATEVAAWNDGTPLIATRTFGSATEVALNFYPVSGDVTGNAGWLSSTSGAQILANAIEVAANYSDDCSDVPEGQTYMMAGIGLLAISLLLKRSRRLRETLQFKSESWLRHR